MEPKTFITKLQKHGGLTLPASLRRRHHLDEPGAQVEIRERDDGVIELHPQLAIPADQRWFWTERWQKMEQEADADIAAGRVERFDTVEDFIVDLDALQSRGAT